MDFLTHLCLPLAVVVVWWPDPFVSRPPLLVLGVFGLLSDFDKFLGMPGLLHSLVVLGPLCLGVLLGERLLRGEYRYSLLVTALVASHVPLDVLDGGPVPLLYPVVETGVGLRYPVRTVFGEGLLGVTLEGPLVTGRYAEPRQGHNTYGFLTGYGVVSAVVLVVVYARFAGVDRV